MSTDVNQSIHAIPYKDFDGFLDFMAKKVILAILAIFAILGVEDAPLQQAECPQDSTGSPSEGPSPFHQPHNVFWLLAPHTFMTRGLFWYTSM